MKSPTAVPVGAGASGGGSTGSGTDGSSGGGPGGGTATLVREAPRAEVRVRQAASFTAGALGMAVTAVGIHVGKTLVGLIRR